MTSPLPPNPRTGQCQRQINYREVFSSESVTGISAGVAVALIGEESLRDDFQLLTPQQGFPLMPESSLVLHIRDASQTPLTQAMGQVIENAFA